MNVSLSDETNEIIARLVQSGAFPSAEAVIETAVQSLEIEEPDDPEYWAYVRDAARVGMADIEAGRLIPWTDDSMEELIARARANRRQRLGA